MYIIDKILCHIDFFAKIIMLFTKYVYKPFDSSGLKKLFMIEGYSRSLGVNIKCQQRLTKNSRVVCTYFAALRIISFRFE